MKTDTQKNILIIGAGLSGMSAALYAADHGLKVTLVSSLPSERAQSVMAEGGINAAVNTKGEDDTPEQHYNDTIKAGCFLADPNAVWNMTHAAPGLVRWLHSIGVQFNTVNGELDLRNFGGQKKKRTAFAQSDTGKQLMTGLIDAVRQREANGSITRLNHHAFITLILDKAASGSTQTKLPSGETNTSDAPDITQIKRSFDEADAARTKCIASEFISSSSHTADKSDHCTGCVIRDNYTGRIMNMSADAVIICTGGTHGLYGNTTGSMADTGEVTAELFRLGIAMANLEMVQYHPTTVEIGGKRMLISEAARGEGGRLFVMRNGEKYHFMEEKYPELKNLMPRDITAREIWYMSKEGQVYLDMTEIPAETIEKKLSGLVDDCLTYLNLDLRKEPIPVYPGIHYFMGGIYVDIGHRSSLSGLYAAGECCAQYHGANRLGGNSLLGAIYGGRTAAETVCADLSKDDASQNVMSKDAVSSADSESKDMQGSEQQLYERPTSEQPTSEQQTSEQQTSDSTDKTMHGYTAHSSLTHDAAQIAAAHMSTEITAADKLKLNKIMLDTLGVVRNEAMLKEGEAQILKLHGKLPLLGYAVIESAILRRESRGAHFRDDYPDRDDMHFHKTTVASYDGQHVNISFEDIPERRCE